MEALTDITAVLVPLVAGWSIVRLMTAEPVPRWVGGAVVGLGLYVSLTALGLLLGADRPAVLAFLATIVVAVAVNIRFRGSLPTRSTLGSGPLETVILMALLLMVVRTLAAPFTFIRHTDSIQYLIISHLLMGSDDQLVDTIDLVQLKKRLIGAPALNALQTSGSTMMSVVVFPWIGAMTLVVLAWVVWEMSSAMRRWSSIGLAALAVLSLLSSSRFIMHLTYLNTHLLIALSVLTLAAFALVSSEDASLRRLIPVVTISTTALLVLSRAEGFIFALIVIVPVISQPWMQLRWRRVVLVAYSMQVAGWNVFQLIVRAERNEMEVDWEIILPILVSVIVLVSAVAARPAHFRLVEARAGFGIVTMTAILVPLPFVLLRPTLARVILESWWFNFLAPGTNWGLALWLVLIGLLGTCVLGVPPAVRPMWFPVATFPSFGMVVGIVGENGRVADADSFNRMMMHVYPLSIALIAVTVAVAVCGVRQPARSACGA